MLPWLISPHHARDKGACSRNLSEQYLWTILYFHSMVQYSKTAHDVVTWLVPSGHSYVQDLLVLYGCCGFAMG